MKQLLQSLRTGQIEARSIPSPASRSNHRLIRTRTSLISAGTERTLLEFGKAGWLDKARQQPDKVRQVLDKARTDGVIATLDAVQSKLDQDIAPGYANAGLDVVTQQRLVSNGPHAEVVSVPQNLCADIPDHVPDEHAAFAVVGAIALQGIRLIQPALGESVVVTGLGLIGLMAVQLLRAHGCRVLGVDFDSRKVALAQAFGAETIDLSKGEDPLTAAHTFTRGRGVDAVLITAATKSNDPVHQAALMCRQRGRIVLTGVTGLELSRDDFYKKEISFQVSCSYGPGRYDPAYEQGGHDYPFGHVRFTAQRNFEAVLDMMADGRLNVAPLITHRFPFHRALEAYQLLSSPEFYLGILLEYPQDEPQAELLRRTVPIPATVSSTANPGVPICGMLGAGGYATKVLIPAFRKAGAVITSVASSGGVSAAIAARKFQVAEATTDIDALIANPKIDTIVIATRHDSHARLVCQALQAGKHVFVEKPLALSLVQVDEIEDLYLALSPRPLLMVGFNRRFSPHAVKAHTLTAAIKGPKTFIYTVNAGAIPLSHWTQDPETGGGRIAGEVCHFIDLLRFLAGSPITSVATAWQTSDTASISLTFEDGSLGTIHYLANGHQAFPKERLEIFGDGRIITIDNFRRMAAFGCPRFSKLNLWRQDKGALPMAAAFVQAVRQGQPSPIPIAEILEVARATIRAAQSV